MVLLRRFAVSGAFIVGDKSCLARLGVCRGLQGHARTLRFVTVPCGTAAPPQLSAREGRNGGRLVESAHDVLRAPALYMSCLSYSVQFTVRDNV